MDKYSSGSGIEFMDEQCATWGIPEHFDVKDYVDQIVHVVTELNDRLNTKTAELEEAEKAIERLENSEQLWKKWRTRCIAAEQFIEQLGERLGGFEEFERDDPPRTHVKTKTE